jgi:hypothetical protein
MIAVDDSSVAPAGQAYFISDGSPIDNFLFLKPLCEARGKRFPRLVVPYQIFYVISTVFEWFYHLADSIGASSWVPLTRAEVVKVGVTHYFSIEKAQKELGYKPTLDSQAGAIRLAERYSKWNDDNYFELTELQWYILIPLGMWLTFRSGFYDLASNLQLIPFFNYLNMINETVFRSQVVLQWVFYAAVLCHVIEAIIAFRAARNSFPNTKYLWFFQTLLLGYPSLSKALARSTRNPDAQL